MKRPKGTKSRRWARGLPYASREYPHRMHTILCPDTRGGASMRVAGRIGALCSDCPREGLYRGHLMGWLTVRECCLVSSRRTFDRTAGHPARGWRQIPHLKVKHYRCSDLKHSCQADGGVEGAFPRQSVGHESPVTPVQASGQRLPFLRRGDSRKSSPAAFERRPSFSPFFLGEARKRARE